jgi:hypothetical protein
MNNPDQVSIRIRDPGWKKVGSGIRDKHPGSATLLRKLLLIRQSKQMHKDSRPELVEEESVSKPAKIR